MSAINDSAKTNANKFSVEAFAYSVIIYFFLAFLIGLFSVKIEAIQNNLVIIKAVILLISVWFYRYIKKALSGAKGSEDG